MDVPWDSCGIAVRLLWGVGCDGIAGDLGLQIWLGIARYDQIADMTRYCKV